MTTPAFAFYKGIEGLKKRTQRYILREASTLTERTTKMQVLKARAPVRACDLGGWTDIDDYGKEGNTGEVLNIGLALYAYCTLQIEPTGGPGIEIDNISLGETRQLTSLEEAVEENSFRLFQAALKRAGLELPVLPAGERHMYRSKPSKREQPLLKLQFWTRAPHASGLGTSASLAVAVMGVADRWQQLQQDQKRPHSSPQFIAEQAQLVETEDLLWKAGVQDHWAAALGGISHMYVQYPRVVHRHLWPGDEIIMELEERAVVVDTGKSHFSSAMHDLVIANYRAGTNRHHFEKLRGCAGAGREALMKGDLTAFGEAMNDNWTAQKGLHEGITTVEIEQLHEAVRENAIGFKANGAAGGGTVTILAARNRINAVTEAVEKLGRKIIPVHLDRDGLKVGESTCT